VDSILLFLESNNLLSDHQYGFRKARSTGDLLSYVSHVWSSALDSFGESRVISLDISKAFDRVWHDGLVAKLSSYGFQSSLISWVRNFLSKRSLAVRIDGCLSKYHDINAGVPQGSVLSPILFLLFINDLFSTIPCAINSYADDTYLHTSFSFNYAKSATAANVSDERQSSALRLSSSLDKVINWGMENRVTFNASKTIQMLISKKRKAPVNDLKFMDNPLPMSNSMGILGLNISRSLSWRDHIITTCKKASQKLSFLFRSRKYFSSNQILLLYKTLIRPKLEYCCHVWGGVPKYLINLLDRIQRKACRLIADPVLTETLQTLEHRRRVASLSLFYRYFNGKCSDEIYNIVPPLRIATRPTRAVFHKFTVEISRCRTKSHAESFFPRVAKLWNALPPLLFELIGEHYNLQGFKTLINKLNLETNNLSELSNFTFNF